MTSTAHHSPVPPRRQSSRLIAPDVLRGVAIFSMLIAHSTASLLPNTPSLFRHLSNQLSDLSSPLFALVMGISAQIIHSRTASSARGVIALQQLMRGLILIVLGLWLTSWDSWVVVVLSYLGLLLIVGAPLLFLPSGALIAIAAGLLLLADPINAWARNTFTSFYANHIGDPIGVLLDWTVLGHSYRLTGLLPFFLAGALLYRWELPSKRQVILPMFLVGIALWPVRPLGEKLAEIEKTISGSWLDTSHDISLVLLAYAVVMGLIAIKSQPAKQLIEAVFVPLRACGTIALSLYVVQVAAIAWWASMGYGYQGNEYLLWFVLVPGLVLLGYLWWRFVGLGPIEWLIGVATGRYRLGKRNTSGS